MNLPVKQKQTYRLREQTYGCQRAGKGGEGWIEGLRLANTNGYI